MPALIAKVRVRVERELSPTERAEFWAGMGILMGLAFEVSFIDDLLKGTGSMRGSSYAQLLLKEGREEGREEGKNENAKEMLLIAIEEKFSEIDPRLQILVDSMTHASECDAFLRRVLRAKRIEELL